MSDVVRRRLAREERGLRVSATEAERGGRVSLESGTGEIGEVGEVGSVGSVGVVGSVSKSGRRADRKEKRLG